MRWGLLKNLWSFGSTFTYFQPERLHLQGTKCKLPPSSSFSPFGASLPAIYLWRDLLAGEEFTMLTIDPLEGDSTLGELKTMVLLPVALCFTEVMSSGSIFGILWGGLIAPAAILEVEDPKAEAFSSWMLWFNSWLYYPSRLFLTFYSFWISLWGAWDPYLFFEGVSLVPADCLAWLAAAFPPAPLTTLLLIF